MISLIFISVILFIFAPKELLPQEDRGVYLVIGKTDEGSSFQYTSDKAEEIERRLTPLVKSEDESYKSCLLYTSPSPRDGLLAPMPSSA